MTKVNWPSGAILAVLLLAAAPQSASAGAVAARDGDLAGQVEALSTGDQLIVDGANAILPLAGHDIELSGFSGLIGFGSEVAYLVVVEGTARLGDLHAGRGRMLMIPPFGGEPGMQRFDARRLYEALSEDEGAPGSSVLASLSDLADGQVTGVFFGRLGRTSFNVATLGSAQDEIERRQRLGGTHVRNVRFSESGSGTGFEQEVVERFLAALAEGNVEAVAQFLDPLPFGQQDLSLGGGEARLVMAQALIAQHDWTPFANVEPANSGNANWIASSAGGQARIALRRTTDFAFVQSVSVGE